MNPQKIAKKAEEHEIYFKVIALTNQDLPIKVGDILKASLMNKKKQLLNNAVYSGKYSLTNHTVYLFNKTFNMLGGDHIKRVRKYLTDRTRLSSPLEEIAKIALESDDYRSRDTRVDIYEACSGVISNGVIIVCDKDGIPYEDHLNTVDSLRK